MADAIPPYSVAVSANSYQPDPWTGDREKVKKANFRIGLPYGQRPRPTRSEILPWTEVVLGQGEGDWTR